MAKKKKYYTVIKGVRCESEDPEAHWEHMQELRVQLLELHDRKCQRCGCKVTKQSCRVHHLHYRSFGKEKIEDLSLMCKDCHAEYHDRNRKRRLTPSDMDFVDPERREGIQVMYSWDWRNKGLIDG